MESEMMLHEQLQELSVEFSEELQVILKALKRVAEGKARALEDAAKWKRKYEIEKLQNLQLQNKAEGHRVDGDVAADAFVKDEVLEGVSESSEGCVLPENQNSNCCIKDGICAEKILWKQNSECGSDAVPRPLIGKASFTLSWVCKGNKNTQHEHDIVSFERGNITTAMRRTKQIMLKWDSPPRSVLILTKPNSKSVEVICQKMVMWLLEERSITIYVEPRVRKDLAIENVQSGYIQTWKSNEDVFLLHSKVDLVCTLGGDGTVLWAASLFKGPVPPFLSFSLGSLGFMTPFQSDYYKDCINTVMRGPVSITLRHRLQCSIVRAKRDDENLVEGPILVLNEVTIDRGMSPFLTLLECYCDDSFVTCVQGDGLILSTTSGSTAYSLAAGGSMVHPQVPAILFTPICPHSLSFRPIIFPEYVTLRVQVPHGSRGQASVAFDGKDRKQLKAGDALICNMSSWPVPTICEVDSTHDFLRSVREGLHWNLRKSQSFDGPKDV